MFPIWFAPLGSSSPRRGLCPVGGKGLRIAKSLPFKSAQKPALARPSSWPLAKSSLQWRFKPYSPRRGLCPVGGKGLRIAKSLPFKSAQKPALARPSSWPLAKSSLQWRFKPQCISVSDLVRPDLVRPLGLFFSQKRALSCGRERS